MILQQKPELVVELKSLVADQLQQQGIPAQADSITDEMLLSQISTNAALRSSITVWLRARGYVSAADMDRLACERRPPRTRLDESPFVITAHQRAPS